MSRGMPASIGDPLNIGDDDLLTLAQACKTLLHDTVKPATLRAEYARGRLEVERIGRRMLVTPRAIREMREQCRDKRSAHDYGLDPHGETTELSGQQPGSSSTEADISPQDALSAKLKVLTGPSPDTSKRTTGRNGARRARMQ